MEQHAIILTVNHKPGVLIRVALVFSRRGFNIESLVVSESNNPEVAKMVVVATGNKKTLQQIISQLEKLVDVIHISINDNYQTVQREISLIKIVATVETRSNILQLIHAVNGNILEVAESHVIVEVHGDSHKMDNMVRLFKEHGIIEVIRSGKLVMNLGVEET